MICFYFPIHLFLILLNLEIVQAQTVIPAGNVSGSWTFANTPYHIYGEITIPNGETLTIEPGVDVIFTGHYNSTSRAGYWP